MTPRKILLIDDDPSITTLLQAKLQVNPGVSVAVANSAQAGIESAISFKPDLIVCDIDLGSNADGGALAHQLGKGPSTSEIPIVFLSSMITPGDAERASGGRRLISKKTPVAEIIAQILQTV